MYTFIGHSNWKLNLPEIHDMYFTNDDTEVIVLRGILFFYADQKTTLGKIRENFTDTAITKLVHDKFIKIL